MPVTHAQAMEIATRALAAIASEPRLAGALLAMSGAEADQIRLAAQQPEFAGFVLDFVMEDDQRVMEIANAAGLTPQEMLAAQAVLNGPGGTYWTAD